MTLSSEFERSVRDAVERVLAGGRLEDSRFEAKSEASDIDRLAVRLAGHANASGGRPIIWIFGLDEDSKNIRPVHDIELADLGPQLAKRFDEREAPRFLRDHWFEFGEHGSVLAVEFDTSNPPYVVRTTPGGSDWTVGVPWRTGTRVGGARRSDLQRMLLRVVEVPSVRGLGISLSITGEDNVSLSGRLLFSVPAGAPPAFIPYEDVRVSLATPTHTNFIEPTWGEWDVSGVPNVIHGISRRREPDYAHATRSGIAVEWVGSVPFGASGDLIASHALGPLKRSKTIHFAFEGSILGSDAKCYVRIPLYLTSREPMEWTLNGRPSTNRTF